jgi:hypothetical protein
MEWLLGLFLLLAALGVLLVAYVYTDYLTRDD